jgi:hypothetical protein
MTARRAKPSSSSLARLRLANQAIVGSSFATPEQAVRWMFALQAQDYPGAKWSIALRVPGATDEVVEAALAARTIVRSWPMRGTLHILAAEDLHWILALTTPRLVAGARARRAALDLDERTLESARGLVHGLLGGGRVLGRDALLAAIEEGGVSTAGQRGYHILWHLSQTGTLCFGPAQGKQQSFVLLDEWVPRPRRLERDESLGELARRYFTSHGPATLKDLAWWTKLTARDVKTGLALAQPDLAELVVDGVSYWMARDAEEIAARVADEARASVRLLPGFDEYILGYQDRSAVLPREYQERIVPGGNGMFLPTVVVGGQIVGTWRRNVKKREVVVETEPFDGPLGAAATRGVSQAAEAYAAHLGREGTTLA